jgi:hypothetical protein
MEVAMMKPSAQSPHVPSHPAELIDDELDAVAAGVTASRPPVKAWSGPGDEGPEETITFVYGGL